MSKSGQNNYFGINNQSYAALSLFLQFVTGTDFNEIKFENEKLEDFVLQFNSGKKMICESKYRKATLQLSEFKKILNTVLKHGEINSVDELLIITEKASADVKSLVNNYKYFNEEYRKSLIKKPHNFEDKHFKLIPQVRLWEVSQLKNREGILLLMSRVISFNGTFWIPRDVLIDWVNTLLVEGVYLNSQAGNKLTRKDFFEELENKKIKYIEKNGVTYEEAKYNEQDRIEALIQLVTSNKPKKHDVCANAISELVVNPMLHYYLLKKLTSRTNLILQDWEILWRATTQGAFTFELFKIFENNLASIDNQKYILDFVQIVLEEYAINYFNEEFIKKDIVDICLKILNNNPEHSQKIFNIVKNLYDFNTSKYLYKERGRDDSWEREEISLLLKEIYDKTEDKKLKEDIINYILQNFNIVEDDGKFWHYTPPQLFNIISDYVSQSPEKRILWIAKVAAEQYQKFYQRFDKKFKFDGWEHMGGGIAQFGDEYTISDKHFIKFIIEPALNNISKKKVWSYITTNLITTNPDSVSFGHPDFLNRAAINTIIEEYKSGNYAKDAFNILSSFIKMRKGIPWKPDIIFQYIYNNELTAEQKWELIEVSLKEYKNLPVNVFVEKIIAKLAVNEDSFEVQEKAVEVLTNWAKDPNYRKNRTLASYDIINSTLNILKNPKSFNKGVEIFQAYLNNEDFIKGSNSWGSWDVGKALALVLENNSKKGIELLEELYGYEELSINQQTVLSSAIEDISNDNHKLINEIYDKFLLPTLSALNTNKAIENKFTSTEVRIMFVRYAEKLIKSGEYKKALDLITHFINDSDPPKDGSNSSEDPEGKFNKHKQIEEGKEDFTITTVRGQCAWVLRYYGLLPAKEYVAHAVPLVKRLTLDTNYYVRYQATFPLMEFVRNKDSYISGEEPKKRFIDSSISKEIEDIAFNMLRDKVNQQLPAIMKGLVHVFSGMRAIDQKKAKEIIDIFIKTGFDDILDDTASLLIFFAEFRKNIFKNWPWEKLPEFDDSEFKSLLREQIKLGKHSMRRSLSWQFWRLPNEGNIDNVRYNKDLFKTSIYYLKLFTEEKYDDQIWKNIYHFIEDYLPYEFEACFTLWKECVKKEKPYIITAVKDKNNLHKIYWLPFFYNGRVLLAIYDNLGIDEFLSWVEFMAEYPPNIYIANDFANVVSKLKELPKENERISQIFDKLIERDPIYYDDKQEWLKK